MQAGSHPKEVISEFSEDLLAHYTDKPLVDRYDIYQHLMVYWDQTMQDDCYIIAVDGWKAETSRVTKKDKNGVEKDKGWVCDLVPKALLVARYYAKEQAEIDQLTADLDGATAQLTELEEEYGGEEGVLQGVENVDEAQIALHDATEMVWKETKPQEHNEYRKVVAVADKERQRLAKLGEGPYLQPLKNPKGKITKGIVSRQLKATKNAGEKEALNEYLACDKAIRDLNEKAESLWEQAGDEISRLLVKDTNSEILADFRIISQWINLTEKVAELKKRIKEADKELDIKAYNHYPTLTEAEVKTLVVDDKWLVALDAAIHGEMKRVSQSLTERVKELTERYETPLPQMNSHVNELEEKVNRHLERMGFSWK